MIELVEQLASLVKSGKKEWYHQQPPERQKEITEVVRNLSLNDIEDIFGLFSDKTNDSPTEFYVFVFDLVGYVGHENYTQLGAKLWFITYNHLSHSSKDKFLLELIDTDNRYFWDAIHLMPDFCSEVDLPPELAKRWFEGLYERVKNDLASADFFKGVCNFGYHFPNSAIQTVKLYCTNLDDNNLSLAAILQGSCRCKLSKDKAFQEFDVNMRDNIKLHHRLCYCRSFSQSFERGYSSIGEVRGLLNHMLSGEPKETEEAFRLVTSCSYRKKIDTNTLTKLLEWLKINIKHAKADEAKYWVIQFLDRLYREDSRSLVSIEDTCFILSKIQPIPTDNKNTWDKIEHFLVERLREDFAVFERYFNCLVKSNPIGMANLLEKYDRYLVCELSDDNAKRLITQYLLSADQFKRKIGRIFFSKCEIKGLNNQVLVSVSEKQIRIALLDMFAHPIMEENKGSQLLIALEVAVKDKKDQIRTLYKEELLSQTINYPGSCLEALKERVKDNPLFDEVIRVADKYFSESKEVIDSPANSFSFTGYEKAVEMARNKISKQVREGVEDRSVLLKLVKKIAIVYGTTWSVRAGNELGKPTPLQRISHTVELPRLELIDPEGMTIKRIQYLHLLEE